MKISLVLTLPRDGLTIPVVRHICRHALTELGVDANCRSDIEVAVTEACTNVLAHAGPGDEYEVNVDVDDTLCVIRVIDTGHGFDAAALADPVVNLSAEGGRGVSLMTALVDRIQFISKPEAGTIVHLEKELCLVEGSPGWRLAQSQADPANHGR